MTKFIKINPKKIEISKIKIAAKVLENGGLVAFPTETVYGLGANALDSKAVEKIFKAKGRPSNNPLIVHIAKKKEIYRLAREIPKNAEKVMNKFWPGPLTIVLKKSKIVPGIITSGLDSVAIRMPSNKVALSLILESKVPVAAPSANLSGKPSPTLAKHVIQDLFGKVDVILDGGKTKIGIESTVLDLTSEVPMILRPGKVTLKELEKVLGIVKLHPCLENKKKEINLVKSPGMKYKHYSPKAKVILVNGELDQVKEKIQELINKYKNECIGIMTRSRKNDYSIGIIKYMGNSNSNIANNLFKLFREFDENKVKIILVEGINNKGFGFSIMDRLKRSAYKIIEL